MRLREKFRESGCRSRRTPWFDCAPNTQPELSIFFSVLSKIFRLFVVVADSPEDDLTEREDKVEDEATQEPDLADYLNDRRVSSWSSVMKVVMLSCCSWKSSVSSSRKRTP